MQEHQGLTVHLDAQETQDVADEPTRVLLFESVRELLLNVVKHAQTHEAWVALRVGKRHVRVHVEDQGVGFDPAAVAKAEGESFGLFSIRERLDWLGGSMSVRAEPGKGTRITLTVPRRNAQETPEEKSVLAGPIRGGKPTAAAVSDRVRVMLVDDHDVVRAGLSQLLASVADMEVVAEAANVRTALQQARELHPDVVVMDVSLPDVGGVEATRQLRKDLPGIRVIGLSMHSEDEMASAMLRAGAETYLNKAESPEHLLSAIRQHANQA